MLKLLLSLYLFSLVSYASAQKKIVSVADEFFTVNASAMAGKNSNMVQVTLPPKTVGLICRVTSTPEGSVQRFKPLMRRLRSLNPETLTANSSPGLMNTNPGTAAPINMYIMDHPADIRNFKAGLPFSSCKNYDNRSGICFYTDECLNADKLSFGFVNQNIAGNASVRFELAAVIDDHEKIREKRYPFVITNKANSPVELEWSKDGTVQAYPISLPGATVLTQRFTEKVMYVLVKISPSKFKKYQIISDYKYEIEWNPDFKSWDLLRKG